MSDVGFTNSTSQTLWVAYMRRDFGCLAECGEPWDVLGWCKLLPGQYKERANPTDNRWFYYYAEGSSGSVWSGPYVAEVSQAKFSKCTCLGVSVSHGTSPWHDVGMRELDTDKYSGVKFV